jgi:hypothetical protein
VNDIVDPLIQYRKGVFPFYPSHWALRLRSLWTPDELELLARAQDLAQRSRSLAEQASSAWYGRSAVFGLAASLGVARERRAQAEVEMQLEAATHERDFQSTGPTPHFEREQLLARAAEVWRESSRLLHAMVSAVGGEYYHFLQPDQYVAGSKPLTPREQRVAYRPSSDWGKGVIQGYPYLLREGRKLAEEGIAYRDTTQIFAGEEGDIYIDTCCHLTPRGTQLLAAEILRTILERTQIEALRGGAGARDH